MLSALVAWLSKRFPEQLVVSKAEYKELREEVAQYNLAMQALGQLNERLVQTEAQVKRLNDANGFVSTKKGLLNLER